jgi:archaellum component FlaC
MDDNKVAILLEDLRAQFRAFGDGLQLINEKVDHGLKDVKDEIGSLKSDVNNLHSEVNNLHSEVNNLKVEIATLKSDNRQEHQQLMQMVKELNNEVQVEIKRVK